MGISERILIPSRCHQAACKKSWKNGIAKFINTAKGQRLVAEIDSYGDKRRVILLKESQRRADLSGCRARKTIHEINTTEAEKMINISGEKRQPRL